MASLDLGDVVLHHERRGHGPPLVLVHGSWDDHHSWDGVTGPLSEAFTVIAYDRRGHSRSTCPPGQGRIGEDVSDLAAVVQELGPAPAHLVGHSYGATVVLLLVRDRPELVRRAVIHEPPVFALLADDDATRPLLERSTARMRETVALLEEGRSEEGVRHFVEHVGFGPGSWDGLFAPEAQRTMIRNAGTWLDQARDPDRLAVRLDGLRSITTPLLITRGTAGPPAYAPVVARLAGAVPSARLATIDGAGHAPHLSHAARFSQVVADFLLGG